MAARTYRYYDPLAQALDDAGERWALLVVRELLDGPRRYGELAARLPGLSTARLADRLRELQESGLAAPGPGGYALTAGGKRLAPAIYALTRFGLHRLRPLTGTATVYRPAFGAWALRALADAADAASTYASVTHVEEEAFCTRGTTTWGGTGQAPANADVVRLDTITALSLATGTWTLAEARRDGYLDGATRSWADAHQLGP